MPNANNPDRTVLIPVDNPDDTTKGIKTGLKKPDIKTTVPQISRFLGGGPFFIDVSFVFSKLYLPSSIGGTGYSFIILATTIGMDLSLFLGFSSISP